MEGKDSGDHLLEPEEWIEQAVRMNLNEGHRSCSRKGDDPMEKSDTQNLRETG